MPPPCAEEFVDDTISPRRAVDNMAPLKLYTYPNNKNSNKALIAAKFVNVQIEVPPFNFHQDNKTPHFLALNPAGKVRTQSRARLAVLDWIKLRFSLADWIGLWEFPAHNPFALVFYSVLGVRHFAMAPSVKHEHGGWILHTIVQPNDGRSPLSVILMLLALQQYSGHIWRASHRIYSLVLHRAFL